MSDASPKAVVDGAGNVLNTVMAGPGFAAPPGCTLVDVGLGAAPGGTYAAGVFTPPSASLATVTGNQWSFALPDLGLASAWLAGVAKSKPSDQVRVGLIARDTPLVASDPLLIRVAANAGQDGSGNALIAVPAVHAHAMGMPL